MSNIGRSTSVSVGVFYDLRVHPNAVTKIAATHRARYQFSSMSQIAERYRPSGTEP